MLLATVRGLLARKVRLVLSSIAIVLAVAFVSGTLVLTGAIERSMHSMIESLTSESQLRVVAGSADHDEAQGDVPAESIGEDIAERIRQIPGVREVTPVIDHAGIRVLDRAGVPMANRAGTRCHNWAGSALGSAVASGHLPAADDQAMLNVGLAGTGGFGLGDQLSIRDERGAVHRYTIVGTFTATNGRQSEGGSYSVVLSDGATGQLAYGRPGEYTALQVEAAAGTSADRLVAPVRLALGERYRVATTRQLAGDAVTELLAETAQLRYLLLGAAAIALLVGSFLIVNTFSIVVAQRTMELGLLRALGATRAQTGRSVLVEAALVGAAGSLVGLLIGTGLGWLAVSAVMKAGFGPAATTAFYLPPVAVLAASGIGVGGTTLAALAPAVRAGRISPIAAMRPAEAQVRPVVRLSLAGAAMDLAGAVSLTCGLVRRDDDTASALLLLGGIFGLIIGTAMLMPALSRPVVAAVGGLLARSPAARLGKGQAVRNVRRTGITAAALMVGVTLVTMLATVAVSGQRYQHEQLVAQLRADLVVAGDRGAAMIPRDDLVRLSSMESIASSTAMTRVVGSVGGRPAEMFAVDGLASAADTIGLAAVAGALPSGDVPDGQLLVDDATARQANLRVGDQVAVGVGRGSGRQYLVVGIYADNANARGYLVSPRVITEAHLDRDAYVAFVRLRDGVRPDAVRAELGKLFPAGRQVQVLDRSQYLADQDGSTGSTLLFVQLMLVLAMVIAVLGVTNTMALSVFERTAEFGMLRAIGMSKAQVRRMVTTESMMIALVGAVCGLALGCCLGAAVVSAMTQGSSAKGAVALVVPLQLLGEYLVGAIVIGGLAGLGPAVRASRVAVLGAIATE